jgi:hypothetical protein
MLGEAMIDAGTMGTTGKDFVRRSKTIPVTGTGCG